MQARLKLLAALIAAVPYAASPVTSLAAPVASTQDLAPVTVAAYIPPEPAADAAAAIAQPAAPSSFSQQELEQMLAPIALYPDNMLAQILMASTYPLEVVQAARWSREHPDLAGDDAVNAAQQESWDPSVKSLVAFPQVLGMLDQNIEWMERLGNAVIGQQAQVTQTVQSLRQRAQASGNFASNDQVQVQQQGGDIVVQPTDSEEISVPYYDPSAVYGQWAYPQYPPMVFSPPPADYYVQTTPGFYWGPAIVVGAGFFFGGFDWHHHCINVVSGRPFYYRPGTWGHLAGPGAWHFDPMHRRGVAFGGAGVHQAFNRGAGAYAGPGGWRGPNQAQATPRPAMQVPTQRPAAPVAERSFERPAPLVMRDMPPRGSPGGLPMPMRIAEAHSFGPQTYAYHATAYSPMFSGPAFAHGSPRAPVAFAHVGGGGGGAHFGGGGGGGGGHAGGGGGGHGGGHGGGGHRR
jgi:hypothetical protein